MNARSHARLPAWCGPTRYHTGRDGVLRACLHGGAAMVGYGVLGIDSPMAAHLAGLLAADPARFAILDGAAALPEWRGFGLHQAAIGARIAWAAARGRTLIGATVSPHNLRAMHSLFRAGFRIHAYAPMYGGLERLLVLRDTQAPAPQASAALRVAATDCGAHRAALAAGLAGLDLHQDAGGSWSVGYGPPA
jgi:GNAT superfamily N-acetyltransferase